MTPTYKARAGCLHDLLDAGETAGGADVLHDNLLTYQNNVGDPSSLSCLDLFAVNNVVHRALFSRLAACVACRGDLCNGAARAAPDPSWYSNAFMVDSVALASSADLHKEDERVSFVDLGTFTCDAATSSDGICHKDAHALGCGYDGGDCCGDAGFGCAAPWLTGDDDAWRYAVTTERNPRTLAGQALEEHTPVSLAYGADGVPRGAGRACDVGQLQGRPFLLSVVFPVVSADVSTSDHRSKGSRRVDVLPGTPTSKNHPCPAQVLRAPTVPFVLATAVRDKLRLEAMGDPNRFANASDFYDEDAVAGLMPSLACPECSHGADDGAAPRRSIAFAVTNASGARSDNGGGSNPNGNDMFPRLEEGDFRVRWFGIRAATG